MSKVKHSDKDMVAHLKALSEQPDTVTRYVVMADGRFGGEYEFPNNKDKVEIHWPPGVVEQAPQGDTPQGTAFFWTGSAWEIRALPPQVFIPRADAAVRAKNPLTPWKDLLPEHIDSVRRMGFYHELVACYFAEGAIAKMDENELAALTAQGVAERKAQADEIAEMNAKREAAKKAPK